MFISWGRSCADEFLENLKQLVFGDFGVTVFVDGLDELVDLFFLDLSVAAQTLEGVVDEEENFIALQGAGFVDIVFGENGFDGLSQLVVRWLRTH